MEKRVCKRHKEKTIYLDFVCLIRTMIFLFFFLEIKN